VIIAVIVVAALVVGTPWLALEHRRLRHIEDCWYASRCASRLQSAVAEAGRSGIPGPPSFAALTDWPFGAARRLRVAADFLGDFDDSADGADEAEV
jgi:hypothetical protein